MSTTMLPASRPQMAQSDAAALLNSFHLEQYPVHLLGVRGYYKKSMGNPNTNDLNLYDDALFTFAPNLFRSFNFNTDPSRLLPGIGTLKPGIYLYKLGLHGVHHLDLTKNSDKAIYDQLIRTKKNVPGYTACYWAFRQYGRVTVIRNGKEDTDTPDAPFFVDIHRGGINTTSSAACQTVPPTQWDECYEAVQVALHENNQTIFPYALVEM